MGKIFCSADWHGCYEPAKKLLDYLKPDDTLYYLGDAIDRGDRGFELLEMLLTDPRVKMIAGNHEMMMIETLQYYIYSSDEDYRWHILYNSNWFYNGGQKTWDNKLKNKTDAELNQLINAINKLPSCYTYQSSAGHKVILEHAGYTPTDRPFRNHDPYWDREHFLDNWEGSENTYIVHGHTPVQYLKFMYGYKDAPPLTREEKKLINTWYNDDVTYIPEVIQYCGGHKIDIDCCTIDSNRVALLNLDTFKTIYFDGQKEIN